MYDYHIAVSIKDIGSACVYVCLYALMHAEHLLHLFKLFTSLLLMSFIIVLSFYLFIFYFSILIFLTLVSSSSSSLQTSGC